METMLSAQILFDGENEYTMVNIVFNETVITGIEASKDNMSKGVLITPPYTDNYVSFDDYISFLSLDKQTLSSLDRERVIRVLCLSALSRGVLDIALDIGKQRNLVGLQCNSVEITYLYRINSVEEVYELPSSAIPVISEDTRPNELVRIVRELENKLVFLRFLLRRREPFAYKKETGHWPLQYFERTGLFSLNKKYILVYSNWLSSMDLEVLKYYSDRVLLVPSASKTMELCNGGFTPVYEALEKGVRVGIATSGLSCSPLEEAFILYRLYKYNYWDTRLDTDRVYRILYTTYKGFAKTAVGCKPDFIVYRLPPYIAGYKMYMLYNRPVPLAVYKGGRPVFIRENYLRLVSEIEELLGALK